MPPRALNRPRLRAAVLAMAAALPLMSASAHAADGERESLEALRQTTLALIDLLVANGTLSRDKADALLAEAKARATRAVAEAPKPAAEAPVVRVPYVPQVVRDQIRNEVREEVVARARAERWGVPNATAAWTDFVQIDGDLRVRSQTDRYDAANPTPQDFLTASLTGVTRAADFAAGTAAGLPTANTDEDRDRLRLRARLGVTAKVSDTVTAGIRLATGSSTDRVSTNQTLGQNFNRYAFLVDRAFIKLDPVDGFSLSAGRIANPWFSTDLVWSDNLNFEGLAATFSRPQPANATVLPFFTVGYFPVREDAPPRSGRAISGAQLGLQWEAGDNTRLKFGIAQYDFRHFEGQVDTDYDAVYGAGRSYGQYEYEAGLRQRGNTLFLTNSPLELQAGLTPDKARWGLASRFRPVAVTAAAQFRHLAPVVVGLSAEYVKNTAFDRAEIQRRTGVSVTDGRDWGLTVRGTVGAAQVREAGDWQASLMWRSLGSDALPDAFVDSDLGLGGTNVRGFAVGVQYGLSRNTQLGARYLSGRNLDSPTVQPTVNDRFSVDSLQVDLNVRF